MNMSMNMSLSKERKSKNVCILYRKTANFRGAFVYRNGPKRANLSKWTARIDLNINVDCIRTGWPSINTESV